MGDARLERVRGDLEVMREAAGLGLPFGWEDVWLGLAAVPCGAFLSLVGAFAPMGSMRLALVPALVLALGAVGLRYRFRKGTGRSPTRRREYSIALAAALVYGGLAGVYLAWAQRAGEPTRVSGGMAVAMTGGLCAVLVMTGPGRRSLLGAAGGLLAYGLAIPFLAPREVVVAGGAVMAGAGLLGAAIQAWQLKAIGGGHERAAD